MNRVVEVSNLTKSFGRVVVVVIALIYNKPRKRET